MAARVARLGTRTSNGMAFSAAMRVSSSRTHRVGNGKAHGSQCLRRPVLHFAIDPDMIHAAGHHLTSCIHCIPAWSCSPIDQRIAGAVPSNSHMPANILQQHQKMQRGRSGKRQSRIARSSGRACSSFCVDGNCPDASDFSSLQGAQDGIPQQGAAHAFSLPGFIDRQVGQQHDRHRMAGKPLLQALRCVKILNLPDGQAVVPDDSAARPNQRRFAPSQRPDFANACLRSQPFSASWPQSKASTEWSRRSFSIERGRGHFAEPASKNPGSSRRACRRGSGRAGASRAAWNSAHFSASKPKTRRSAKVSSARERALSITKSLMERRVAEGGSLELCLRRRRNPHIQFFRAPFRHDGFEKP